MRAKSLILLVVALGCGMIAAVGVSKALTDKQPQTAAELTTEIFVAVKDMPTAQKVSADSVKLEKWPTNRLPDGALTKLDEIEGRFTNTMIFANEPILKRKIAETRDSFSTNIPPGYRIFDIACSSGYIKPGDHVDITGTFKKGGRNANPETRTVMRNVQVIGINGVTTRDSEDSKSGKNSVFQLLIKESQLEALTLANSLGSLNLNLRPFEEERKDSELDNGESFLSWLNQRDAAESEVIPTDTAAQLLNGLQNMIPAGQPTSTVAAPEAKKHEMTIVTPNGVTRYEWSGPNDLPRQVEAAAPLGTPGQTSPWPSSENVYSGYGGYSPTYPTSTTPSGPGASIPGQSDGGDVGQQSVN